MLSNFKSRKNIKVTSVFFLFFSLRMLHLFFFSNNFDRFYLETTSALAAIISFNWRKCFSCVMGSNTVQMSRTRTAIWACVK